ncbi:NAD-dependent succinate-semialdehyde dehydrogenase [Pseudoalteromonas sp. T1lg65]|uniref:NAD-dependent succinate-semialdehyde dehydrogenase n=1 Tax=Pseudoalteromonas sp. T1lg65 TaxID=2077101 RepID=UPI003F7A9821
MTTLIHHPEYSLVGGKPYQNEQLVEVDNPATEETINTVTEADLAAADQAIEHAKQALQTLRSESAHQRGKTLMQWHSLIMKNRDELAELMTEEQGKPLKEALAEVDYAAGFVQWYAEEAKRSYGQIIPSHSSQHQLSTIKQGVGIVVGITPWNFPLAMITRKVAPAYAAGCSFILKPSEKTPLSALALAKLALLAGMPDGALQVLVTNQSDKLVSHLLRAKEVRKLTFTGSTKVGRLLLEQSAATIKRTSMELGGNAPFIVFESADLDAALEGLMAAKFRNAGQTCVAANRVLVHTSIREQFIKRLLEKVTSLQVGNGFSESVDIGPLISREAKRKAEQLVLDAVAGGAELLTQSVSQSGRFMGPVVLDNVSSEMEIAKQEIFAPVVAIMTFNTQEQALEIANGVQEGLAAYFYSTDSEQIRVVSEALEYGMIGINEGMISNPVAPFGGIKCSGLGREGAQEGLLEYQEVKYLCQKFKSSV